jgi:phosphoribosylanthranilate isomerase
MTIVKICGLRSLEAAIAAVEAGADLLGCIFAPARRQVSPDEVAMIARAVAAAAQSRARRVGVVGVFVDAEPEQMAALALRCDLAALQLSGDERVELLDVLPPQHRVIKALRFTGAASEQAWLHAAPSRVRLLVDAHTPGSYGGAGVLADWAQASELARRRAIILAGGLTPDNVAEAVRRVRPWGVDVSSGVETNGVKDIAKIQAFVAAVRAVDHEQGIPADR